MVGKTVTTSMPAVPIHASASIAPLYGIEWLCFFIAAALVYFYVRYIRSLKVPPGVWIAAVAGDALFAAIYPPGDVWTRLAAFGIGAVFIVSEVHAIYSDRDDAEKRYKDELVKRDEEANKRAGEAQKREEEAVRTQNRLAFLFDRMEASNLMAILDYQMPQREAQAAGSGNENQRRIILLAGSLMDFAKLRLSVQPPPMTQKGYVYSSHASTSIIETSSEYKHKYEDNVNSEREYLAGLGIRGKPYEEAVYDLPTVPNMFRIADLLSRLALRIPPNV